MKIILRIFDWPFGSFPVHHWPITDSKLYDVVGDAQFVNFSGISFTNDRFGFPDSAVRLNNGKLVLPPGIYFGGDFTLMVWTKIDQLNYESVLFSCKNNNAEIVHISYMGGSYLPYFSIYNQHSPFFLDFTSSLIINEWYHIVVGFKSNIAFVYLNGNLNTQIVTHGPNPVLRDDCFFGSDITMAVLDDMKIFNYALSDDEILSHYYS